MNVLDKRHEAATRVQAAYKSYSTRKTLERKRVAATVIQRQFRKKKDFTAATMALENARRRRRIRKHELESKYLKTLQPDMFEKYKSEQRRHAAVVIQRAWRRRTCSDNDLARKRGFSYEAPPSSSNRHSLDPFVADEELYDESDLKGIGQTNSTEYWGLLSQEKKAELLAQIRRRADRLSEYEKAYSRDDDKRMKNLLQECYESLTRFSKLQRAKSRLSKKAALLSNQLLQTQSSSYSLDDIVTSAEIDFSALPPLPTGKRLAHAQREHEACLKAVDQSNRNTYWRAKQSATSFTHSGDGSYQNNDKEINLSLERHGANMHEKEAQVAQDWSEVNDLVRLAKNLTQT